jgi:hypothetical protein
VTRHQSLQTRNANRFHTIRWSVVLLSAQSQTSGCQEALVELCRLYEEIRGTISDSADVDAEHHELCEALIAAEGRIMP